MRAMSYFTLRKSKERPKADSTLFGFVPFPMKRCKNMPIAFAVSAHVQAQQLENQ
jgi:hypothetical protein